MRFEDGSTTCFDVAYTTASTTTFQQTARFNDNVLVAFGTTSDTYIRHNTTDGHTEFVANTGTGGMRFIDGTTNCFDVAETAANTTTFHSDTEFRDSAVVCLDIGKTAPNTPTAFYKR